MANGIRHSEVRAGEIPSGLPEESWILRFLSGVSRYRWTAIGLFTFSVAVAAAIAFLSTEIYRGRALLMPKRDLQPSGLSALSAGGLGRLTSQLGLGGGAQADYTGEAIATLKSRVFISSFLEDQNLLPVLFADRWDATAGDWIVEANEIPSLADGYRVFRDIMAVSEDLQTGMVEVKIDWHDYKVVALWTNKLVERLNRVMRERAIEEATQSIEFLNQQLGKTSIGEIRTTIFGLIEANLQTIMIANVREQYAFKVIDPAFTPEPTRFIKPKRLVLLAVGFIFGIFLAGIGVMLRVSVAALPGSPPSGNRMTAPATPD